MIRHDAGIDAGHLTLAFAAMDIGLVPRIRSAAGTSAPVLHTAILWHQQQLASGGG